MNKNNDLYPQRSLDLLYLVDGSWTNWNDWSPCPVSSGTSLQTRVRHCNNPVPNSAGKKCTGDAVESKLCLGISFLKCFFVVKSEYVEAIAVNVGHP